MKILCGLGNPGTQYDDTRHNVGFTFIDYAAKKWDFSPFSLNTKFNTLIHENFLPHDKEKIFLLKPQTFMNRSGAAISAVMHFYKLSPSDLIVVHDDLDMEIGTYKISHNIRAAGHNGVQDIITTIGTQDFTRIRIGIESVGGKKARGPIPGDAYVLQNFTSDEKKLLPPVFDDITMRILSM